MLDSELKRAVSMPGPAMESATAVTEQNLIATFSVGLFNMKFSQSITFSIHLVVSANTSTLRPQVYVKAMGGKVESTLLRKLEFELYRYFFH